MLLNPYKVLDLPFDATGKDVKKAFRNLAKVYHPDVPKTGDPDVFRDMRDAAQELSDEEGRSRWRTVYQTAVPRYDSSTTGTPGGAENVRDLSIDEEVDRFSGEFDDFDSLLDNMQTREQVMQEWMEKKKQRRRQRLRRKLRGGGSGRQPQGDDKTIFVVRKVLSGILGVPFDSLEPDTLLGSIGFYDESIDDVLQILIRMEEFFDIDLASIVGGRYVKFELSLDVGTVSDLTAVVDSVIEKADD